MMRMNHQAAQFMRQPQAMPNPMVNMRRNGALQKAVFQNPANLYVVRPSCRWVPCRWGRRVLTDV